MSVYAAGLAEGVEVTKVKASTMIADKESFTVTFITLAGVTNTCSSSVQGG